MNNRVRLNIIRLSILANSPILLAAAYFFQSREGLRPTTDPEMVRLLFISFSIVSITIFPVLLILRRIINNIPPGTSEVEGQSRIFSLNILMMSLSQAPAVLGFMHYFLSGRMDLFFCFLVISAGLSILAFMYGSNNFTAR
jgi:hypothetical protein